MLLLGPVLLLLMIALLLLLGPILLGLGIVGPLGAGIRLIIRLRVFGIGAIVFGEAIA